MRLIDADALKKNMEFVCMGIMAGTESYKAPLKEIDNAPTIEPQQWISVSERLPEFRHVINPDPEEDGEWDESPFVLVCFDDGDIECRQFIREDGRVFIYPEEFRGRKPTAWLPLPEPWKEGDQT